MARWRAASASNAAIMLSGSVAPSVCITLTATAVLRQVAARMAPLAPRPSSTGPSSSFSKSSSAHGMRTVASVDAIVVR
jgi:hypothetical protein